jgi:hypothetical protein
VRTYGEVIDVRTASALPASALSASLPSPAAPTQFLWRGRLYLVRDVLAHWVELGAWWAPRGAARPGPRPARDLDDPRSVAVDVGAVEREVWRVEAAAGRSAEAGVYDLVRDIAAHDSGAPPEADHWRLARALD